jgi:hypothetical protein
MTKLSFPVLPDGLIVDVVIGLDGDTTTAQIAAGQPVTRPILTRGEIDTGTNITAVNAAILQRLGVPHQFQTTTQTAAGLLTVDVFKVSVGVRNLANPTSGTLVVSKLLVMELTTALQQVEVLIGLDFLLGCRFELDGPGLQFSLEA